jgi:multidrug efflux pump subunit AcrA (membrane-fusion protein)
MDVARTPARNRSRAWLPGAGVVTALALVVAVTCFGRSMPPVDAASVTVDTVKRGSFLREVRAAGSLVPEHVRWVSAISAGRLERVFVQPGARVVAGTVLLEMTNADVQLEVMEAERQLSAAEATLVSMTASLETARLGQAALVASVRSQQRESARQAAAKAELEAKQLITKLEAAQATDAAEELTQRLRIEEERLAIATRAAAAQIAGQRAEITRMRAIVAFHRQRLDALTVRASQDGVVQEIPSETGQWINPGQTLVKLQSAGKLKATLRVPEMDAKDVAPGQPVRIDTRNGIAVGRVARVNPAVQGGVVLVDVALPDRLPVGARPDLSVDGVIEVERINDALYVARMPDADVGRTISVYKLSNDAQEAVRVPVRIGRMSTVAVELRAGLAAGDVVIVSALPVATNSERIRIRN